MISDRSKRFSRRRKFLTFIGTGMTTMLAGCGTITIEGNNDIQDTDGDGVIDSEDYAPRDESVQRAEQVKENSAQTESSTEAESGKVSTQVSSDLEYGWESGNKSGWKKTNVKYGDYVAKFKIISTRPISGGHSAQIEALNDRVTVRSPRLLPKISADSISSVSGSFRLEGDLDAHEVNSNQFSIVGPGGKFKGRVLFYHGDMEIRWNEGDNPKNSPGQTLRQFSSGKVYDIKISAGQKTFSVNINGKEYAELQTADGNSAEIGQIVMHSRNNAGVGPSIYDDSIYFTWDDIQLNGN